MTPSVIEIAVNGAVHRVAVPAEWSGGLAFVVNVHRGQASKKILVGRLAAIILAPNASESADGPKIL